MLTLGQPNFSLYALINMRDVSGMFEERFSRLLQWSRLLEDTVLEQNLSAEMAVGFQEMNRITPQIERYRRLCDVAQSVTVFALPDAKADVERLRVVALQPGDALLREWFVIVRHPNYTRALVAREQTGTPRSFRGILTSDPAQVERFYEALMQAIQQKA